MCVYIHIERDSKKLSILEFTVMKMTVATIEMGTCLQ